MDVPESLTLMPSESAAEAGDELAVRFHLASATLSALVAGVGLAVLIGWWVESPALTSVLPGLVAMKANAAFGLALTGAAVWLHRLPDAPAAARVAIRVCAAAAAAVALLTIAEFVTGWNLHVDQILAIDHSTAGAPGRMALATAVCLALLDGAVVLAARPARYAVAELLVGAAFMLATLCGFGYFFVLDAADAGVGYGFMAVHTSVGLLLLCLAFLFARPDDGLMATIIDSGPGGLIIRRLLPVLFVVPLLLAWLSWLGVRAGSYEPGFAVALFATLTVFALGVALVAGGRLLRRFEDRRIAAETELARSEERLRRAVTDAPIPMVIHDGDAILEMSTAWAETSGYTQADTPTLTAWTARTQAQAADRMAAHLANLAQAIGTVPAGEQPIRTRDGGTRIWDLSSTPLGSPAAGSRLFVTMGVDVTARTQADAELRLLNDSLEYRIAERTVELTRVNDALKRQSDQLEEQATLLDLVRDGILVRDLYGTIIYWNAGAADLYGWTKDEALGRVSHQLLRAEYPRPLKEIEQHVLQTGFWEGEAVHARRDGVRFPVESRWTLTRTDRGVAEGFLEVNRDITPRKQARDSLRDSERRFRAVAETAIEGILTLDATGIVRYWNPGAERLFGPRADTAVGRPVTFALPEPFLTTQGLAAREATVGTTFETIGRREDGTEFPIELSLATWTNTQGARFFTAIVRDITERKEAVRALEAKAAELARSNQELQQFAYVASHDLQEPLRMVANYTQLLARRYKDQLDSDANEFIEFAVDGAKRMQDLIHDLLQYARVGTKGKAFRPTPADRILADALANLAGTIEETQAEVQAADLPTLVCDASQMAQVFQNLVGNAVKFRRPGTRPVVRVSASRSDTGWTIAVRDNGIGIAPKYFDRIFQMFQRLHGRGEYPGTGIGLPLCRKIVERHGGTMHVASEPDRGTTFSFTLPDAPPGA